MSITPGIIIIDDEEGLATSLEDIMTEEGYDVESAFDGQSGLALCREKKFDVAIVDIKLPDMSGNQVAKNIAEFSPWTECILITGNASLESAVEAVISCWCVRSLANAEQLQVVRYERTRRAVQPGPRFTDGHLKNAYGFLQYVKPEVDSDQVVTDACEWYGSPPHDAPAEEEENPREPEVTAPWVYCQMSTGTLVHDRTFFAAVNHVMQECRPNAKEYQPWDAWLYITPVCFQLGGPYWKLWNECMVSVLLQTQKSKEMRTGSWNPTEDWHSMFYGRVFPTAVACLCLETYYRFPRTLDCKRFLPEGFPHPRSFSTRK